MTYCSTRQSFRLIQYCTTFQAFCNRSTGSTFNFLPYVCTTRACRQLQCRTQDLLCNPVARRVANFLRAHCVDVQPDSSVLQLELVKHGQRIAVPKSGCSRNTTPFKYSTKISEVLPYPVRVPGTLAKDWSTPVLSTQSNYSISQVLEYSSTPVLQYSVPRVTSVPRTGVLSSTLEKLFDLTFSYDYQNTSILTTSNSNFNPVWPSA